MDDRQMRIDIVGHGGVRGVLLLRAGRAEGAEGEAQAEAAGVQAGDEHLPGRGDLSLCSDDAQSLDPRRGGVRLLKVLPRQQRLSTL